MSGVRPTDYFKMFNDSDSQCVTNSNRDFDKKHPLERETQDSNCLSNDYFNPCNYQDDENIGTNLSLDYFHPDFKRNKSVYKPDKNSKRNYDRSPHIVERNHNTINIQNDQLPFLLDNIINLKSHIKEIKTNENLEIGQCHDSSLSYDEFQRKIPNFDYPSEQSNKPYIEHCETGNYYNTNDDYIQNNSDFFRGSDMKIDKHFSDYSFSTTPSIGTPELPLNIEYSRRRHLVHYLKTRFKHKNNSNYSIASVGSQCRRIRRRHIHLRYYTRRFKNKFKRSFSRKS